tara:strand:+ start:479 stop:658 length:180 start_codon:yes stop_codon:yes gene_type:complete
MYKIILKTWYQEAPYERFENVIDSEFEGIREAVYFLSANIDQILDEHPVDGEIAIKFKK